MYVDIQRYDFLLSNLNDGTTTRLLSQYLKEIHHVPYSSFAKIACSIQSDAVMRSGLVLSCTNFTIEIQ